MKNIESLNAELLEKQDYIEKLERDNQQLAKLLHKDNKLIPAMELALENYINETCLTLEDRQRGQDVLQELKELSKGRKGMITNQQHQCEQPPTCGLASIDHLLQYIQQKALTFGISFHVTLDCSVSDFVQSAISEENLCTLLADLLDNAIIATKYNGGRHILLNISMLSKHYSLHVFDCGIPFTKEVLAALGQQQITTHADDSGSGIGLIQTYEILKQYNASLLIDEFTTDTGLYTKRISVVFNRQNQYTLYTTRDDETISFLNHRADLIIIRK
jgi:signal transduction histidine kinase